MAINVKFSCSPTRAGRIHYVNEDDVRVVLGRLPKELWNRLRAVHFNDRARGRRILGYVNRGHREIALCAMPNSMALSTAVMKGQKPEHFGAKNNKKWPMLAVRRFMLYDVFLHELGHLQLVDEERQSERLRFAREKLAEKFAMEWCRRLWAEPFDHPDPVHNRPTAQELALLEE